MQEMVQYCIALETCHYTLAQVVLDADLAVAADIITRVLAIMGEIMTEA
jgi:hypothetical protein